MTQVLLVTRVTQVLLVTQVILVTRVIRVIRVIQVLRVIRVIRAMPDWQRPPVLQVILATLAILVQNTHGKVDGLQQQLIRLMIVLKMMVLDMFVSLLTLLEPLTMNQALGLFGQLIGIY